MLVVLPAGNRHRKMVIVYDAADIGEAWKLQGVTCNIFNKKRQPGKA